MTASCPVSSGVAAIVAMDEARIIGKGGALPWHLPEDLAHFKSLTMGQVVVMGRKTWESLPLKFRPLPGRINIVVSRSPEVLQLPEGVERASSAQEAIRKGQALAAPAGGGGKVWIIGGAELYRQALPLCDEVFLTRVDGVHDGDVTFPAFEEDFAEAEQRRGERCTFVLLKRRCEQLHSKVEP